MIADLGLNTVRFWIRAILGLLAVVVGGTIALVGGAAWVLATGGNLP